MTRSKEMMLFQFLNGVLNVNLVLSCFSESVNGQKEFIFFLYRVARVLYQKTLYNTYFFSVPVVVPFLFIGGFIEREYSRIS